MSVWSQGMFWVNESAISNRFVKEEEKELLFHGYRCVCVNFPSLFVVEDKVIKALEAKYSARQIDGFLSLAVDASLKKANKRKLRSLCEKTRWTLKIIFRPFNSEERKLRFNAVFEATEFDESKGCFESIGEYPIPLKSSA